MIDHVSVRVSDLAASSTFYDRILGILGLARLFEDGRRVGYGKTYPEFWINLREGASRLPDDSGFHICLRARSKEAVARFHETAVELGARSDGHPGLRKAALVDYFAAFVVDYDGNKIEVMTVPENDP